MPSIDPNDQSRFQSLLANDPEIQSVIRGVWGNTPVNQRPSDTPKNLEAANHAASQRIGQILASRGVQLPPRTFINPRSMSLEGAHGWAGLPPAVKAAIIAGVAATGVGAAGALGAFGGGAAGASGAAGAAGSAVPSLGVTSGLAAGAFPAIAGTSGAALAGGTAAAAGGIGAAAKGASMASSLFGGGSTASKIAQAAKLAGSTAAGLSAGAQKGREAQNAAASDAASFKLRESGQHETGLENRAQLELQRKQDARLGQSDSYKKALQAALAMNMQDVGVSGVPKGIPVINFTGGARPSAIGPEGRAAAKELNRQAMAKLMSGESYDPLPQLERTSAPSYKGPGAFENITGAIGLGANAINNANAENEQSTFQQKIIDAIKGMSQGTTPRPPLPPPPPPGSTVPVEPYPYE